MAMISRLVAVSFFLLSLLSFCCVLFLVVAVSFFFFLLKTAYEIGVRLVGSVLCIRDRYLQQAHAIDSAGGAGNGDDQSFGGGHWVERACLERCPSHAGQDFSSVCSSP